MSKNNDKNSKRKNSKHFIMVESISHINFTKMKNN